MSSCLTVATGDSTRSLSATWQLWAPAVLLGLTLFAMDEARFSEGNVAPKNRPNWNGFAGD